LAKEAAIKSEVVTFDGTSSELRGAVEKISAKLSGQKLIFQEGKFGENASSWQLGGTLINVSFSSSPDKSAVLIDGQFLCTTPCQKNIAEGNHEIQMGHEFYLERKEIIMIKKPQTGKKQELEWSLKPDFGWVTVNSNKSGLAITIDGKVVGKTPITKHRINRGPHQIESENNCYLKTGENFIVERGIEKVINIDLVERESAIEVYAADEAKNDLDAEVFVDGKLVGTTPLKSKISLCSKNIEIKKAGTETFSQTLNLIEQKIETISAILKREKVETTISSNPAGVEVFVDGEFICKTPCNTGVYSGERKITLRKDGYEEKIEKKEIAAGTNLLFTLKKDEKNYEYPYKWYGISALGVSGISLITGLIFNKKATDSLESAKSDYSKYINAETPEDSSKYWSKYKGNQDKYETNKKYRNIFYGISGAFAVTGVICFLFKKEIPKDQAFYIDPETKTVGMIFKY